jgi:hypothetical protein
LWSHFSTARKRATCLKSYHNSQTTCKRGCKCRDPVVDLLQAYYHFYWQMNYMLQPSTCNVLYAISWHHANITYGRLWRIWILNCHVRLFTISGVPMVMKLLWHISLVYIVCVWYVGMTEKLRQVTTVGHCELTKCARGWICYGYSSVQQPYTPAQPIKSLRISKYRWIGLIIVAYLDVASQRVELPGNSLSPLYSRLTYNVIRGWVYLCYLK